jgi:predicted aspartyl protease
MGLWRGLALVLVVVASVAVASSRAATLPGYHATQLTRGSQNHLLAPATVNGQPATFLLDTGADASFLQAERAQAFGVQPTGVEAPTGRRSFPVGVATDLRIGGMSLGSATFSIYRAAQLGGPVPGRSGRAADGLLGRDLLRRYNAVINCRSRQLFLASDPARRLNLAATARAQGFAAIPIEETRRGLTVPCMINGRAGRLVLDTGAFLTGFDDDAARLLGLTGEPSAAKARSFEGRVRPLQLVQVDDLRIGGVRIPPQKFVVTDLFQRRQLRTYTGLNRIEFYAPRPGARGDRIYGLLGSELLDLHQAIIDLGTMTLFMK